MRPLQTILPLFALTATTSPLPDLLPFSFRDYRVGDSEAQHKVDLEWCSKLPGAVVTRECSTKINHLGNIADEQIYGAQFDFTHDALDKIDITLETSSYDRVVQAFSIKWGKPCEQSAPIIHNGVGTAFTNDKLTWCFSDGKLTASRFGGKVTQMRVLFRTTAVLAEDNAPPTVNF